MVDWPTRTQGAFSLPGGEGVGEGRGVVNHIGKRARVITLREGLKSASGYNMADSLISNLVTK